MEHTVKSVSSLSFNIMKFPQWTKDFMDDPIAASEVAVPYLQWWMPMSAFGYFGVILKLLINFFYLLLSIVLISEWYRKIYFGIFINTGFDSHWINQKRNIRTKFQNQLNSSIFSQHVSCCTIRRIDSSIVIFIHGYSQTSKPASFLGHLQGKSTIWCFKSLK